MRAYRRGMDSAYRPVDQVDVAEVDCDPPLDREELMALAWSSTTDGALADAGSEQPVELIIPRAAKEPPAIDPALLERARLGLPVATRNDGQALALLRAHGARFRGVVWARGESPMAWAPSFAPYLGIGLLPPPTTAEAETALALLAERPPSDEEWFYLDQVEPGQVRAALAWAAGLAGGRFSVRRHPTTRCSAGIWPIVARPLPVPRCSMLCATTWESRHSLRGSSSAASPSSLPKLGKLSPRGRQKGPPNCRSRSSKSWPTPGCWPRITDPALELDAPSR